MRNKILKVSAIITLVVMSIAGSGCGGAGGCKVYDNNGNCIVS